MTKSILAGAAAAFALAVPALLSGPAAFAQHDSNTLHKLGKAIEYPVRKSTSNLSVDAHRATGHNSVTHRRNGNRTHDTLITPKGHTYRMRHHRHH